MSFNVQFRHYLWRTLYQNVNFPQDTNKDGAYICLFMVVTTIPGNPVAALTSSNWYSSIETDVRQPIKPRSDGSPPTYINHSVRLESYEAATEKNTTSEQII